VPGNFSTSARFAPGTRHFVIEADEYDSAFFDKRAKFVHYRPRTAVLNNLEFDHADIYRDVAEIQKQFHHLVRIVPGKGRIVWNVGDARLVETLAMGCWSEREGFARADAAKAADALWTARPAGGVSDYSRFEVLERGKPVGVVEWSMMGAHNMENALAAIAAARHAGVPVAQAMASLKSFEGVARRMQMRGEVKSIKVYDDFAHHPTAIHTTLDGLRRRVGKERIVAVLEARSNTMKMGVHRDTLAPSLGLADEVWLFAPPDLGWDTKPLLTALGARGHGVAEVDAMADQLAKTLRPGDHALIMSNGGFGGLHGKLLAKLEARFKKP
jgi:UDP-N-acetylmuramate: L-alanyl-gamma-D-glutamyl-meso-diaminopimelate ligase